MKKTLKKSILIFSILTAFSMVSNAQEIGVRFGNLNAGSLAIDGTLSTGDFNRIHGNLAFGNIVGVDLLWDFLYLPLGSDAFKLYVGAGPYAGLFKINDGDAATNDNKFNLGAVFEAGLEYRFTNIPVAMGIDYRPTLKILDETEFNAEGFGFNIRYIFGY